MTMVLTGLIPTIYEGFAQVAKEPVGMINAVSQDFSAEEAAKDQTIRSGRAPDGTSENITPAMTVPTTGGQTMTSDDLVLDQAKAHPILWQGEEQASVRGDIDNYLAQQFAQAIRKANNDMEAHVTGKVISSSRAYGTAGTTPFASNLNDLAEIERIMIDNGAGGDRSLVINSAAKVNLGKLTQLTNANQAGTDSFLRQGIVGQLFDFNVRVTGQPYSHTAGSGSAYQLNGALAIGDTTVTVDTGTGTILAGDVVTISNHKYVAKTALSGGSFTINSPGIREVVADNTAITVNASHVANPFFSRDAIVLATRAPKLPTGGDLATEARNFTDPHSGITYQIRRYPGYHQARWEVDVVYGAAVMNPFAIGTLLG